MGFVDHILAHYPRDRVIATCRHPNDCAALIQLSTASEHKSRLLVLPLEVTSPSSHDAVKQRLAAENVHSIDVLIANAGVISNDLQLDDFFGCTPDNLEFVWRTNVLGTMLTMQSYSDLLLRSRSKLCVVISSTLGSKTVTKDMPRYTAYRASKAAVNMLAVNYAAEGKVRQAGGKALCLHPGWVKTDMGRVGGAEPPLPLRDSVTGMLSVIDKACEVQALGGTGITEQADVFMSKLAADHCVFVGYDGRLIDW